MSILVLAEHDNAILKDATLAAVTAATQLGGDVHLLVAGKGAAAVAAAGAKVAGFGGIKHNPGDAARNASATGLTGQNVALACNAEMGRIAPCPAVERGYVTCNDERRGECR